MSTRYIIRDREMFVLRYRPAARLVIRTAAKELARTWNNRKMAARFLAEHAGVHVRGLSSAAVIEEITDAED